MLPTAFSALSRSSHLIPLNVIDLIAIQMMLLKENVTQTKTYLWNSCAWVDYTLSISQMQHLNQSW